MDTKLTEFRKSIDSDEGLQSKRKLLVMVCVTFLALNLSGATLEEANTFIFKITFSNYAGLSYLFVAGVIFLTLRYYSYAQDHQSKLYDLWSGRLLADYKVFIYDHEDEEVRGLLGNAIKVYGGDEPGIRDAKYHISGFFQRSICYPSEGMDDVRGPYSYTEYISLSKFNEKWRPKHYLWLLILELKYQLEATFKYRESLDLLAPYLLSISAIVSYILKSRILSLLQVGT